MGCCLTERVLWQALGLHQISSSGCLRCFFFFLFFGVHFFSCVGWTKEAITEKHRAMSLALPEVPGVGKQAP